MNREKGFTLVEILLTLVLYALFSSSLLLAYRVITDTLIAAKENSVITLLLKQKAGEMEEQSLREQGLVPQTLSGDFQTPFEKYHWEQEVVSVGSGLNELKIRVRGMKKSLSMSTFVLPPPPPKTETAVPEP